MNKLFKQNYMIGFDHKKITKLVKDKFDDIHFKEMIVESYDLSGDSKDIVLNSFSSGYSDPTFNAVREREKLIKQINDFYATLESVKATFTEEEIMIFKYSLEAGEKDEVIQEKTRYYNNKFYCIKNSLYFKLALKYNLINPYTRNIAETVSERS